MTALTEDFAHVRHAVRARNMGQTREGLRAKIGQLERLLMSIHSSTEEAWIKREIDILVTRGRRYGRMAKR